MVFCYHQKIQDQFDYLNNENDHLEFEDFRGLRNSVDRFYEDLGGVENEQIQNIEEMNERKLLHAQSDNNIFSKNQNNQDFFKDL